MSVPAALKCEEKFKSLFLWQDRNGCIFLNERYVHSFKQQNWLNFCPTQLSFVWWQPNASTCFGPRCGEASLNQPSAPSGDRRAVQSTDNVHWGFPGLYTGEHLQHERKNSLALSHRLQGWAPTTHPGSHPRRAAPWGELRSPGSNNLPLLEPEFLSVFLGTKVVQQSKADGSAQLFGVTCFHIDGASVFWSLCCPIIIFDFPRETYKIVSTQPYIYTKTGRYMQLDLNDFTLT